MNSDLNINQLLDTLARAGIKLGVVNGQLSCDAPKGALSAPLRAQITLHRAQLLQALANPLEAIVAVPRPALGLPLSYAQRRLWLLDRIEGGSARYNLVAAVRLDGPLDLAAVDSALQYIVARHEILRTRFALRDDEPVQLCEPAVQAFFTHEHHPEAQADAMLARAIGEEGRFVFELGAGPLLRTLLLSFGAQHHVLITNQHHIVTDAWSQRIFARELGQAYAAFAAGQAPALAPMSIQYADFASWQRQHLQGAALQSEIDFWRTELDDLPALLAMPTDFARPASQTYRGQALPVHIPAPLVQAMRDLGRASAASVFMVLHAALSICLGRHAGSDDIAIGTPVANRNRPEVEELIGFFVNTLVLRCRLDDSASFRTLLEQVRSADLRAFAHQEAPFELIVDALKVRRDLSYSPLFQVMLSFLSDGRSGQAAQIDVPQQHVLFDLDWQLRETANGIEGHLIYASDLFSHERAATLVAHLLQLLASAVSKPDDAVATLAMLDPAESARMLGDWNATAAPYPVQCVHTLFAAQVQRTPHAVAIHAGGADCTYAELAAMAEGIAHQLHARGARPGCLVGLCAGRSARTVAALLGILMTGAAYVPLDPGFPAERLAFMLDDCQALLVLSEHAVDPALRASLTQHAPLLLLDDLAPEGRFEPIPAQSPETLMYVIYTSGSTGRPKGVMLPHRAVVNFLTSMASKPGLQAADTMLAVTTLSFDIAVLELFLPLLVGARIVLASQDDSVDPRRLIALIERHGASIMQATPATWRMLLAADWGGAAGLTILCGGEALPRELSAQLLPRCRALWNMYGPTETAIWSSVQRIGQSDRSGAEAIGKPIANTRMYVLSPALGLLPAGAVGELCIGGAGLAHGYLNRAQLTAEKFVADPYDQHGARLYRTGDRARYLADGSIELLGRYDHQVKLRGYRIELGEIEAVLERHRDVSQCVVMIREDVAGDPRLVAYVTQPAGADPITLASLQQHLRADLPDYMLPSAIVALAQMPLTPNGKVARQLLPAPAGAPATGPVAAPPEGHRGELAALVAAQWAAVLGQTGPGLDANFFDLGGHSLLIVRLHQRLVSALGVEFDMLELFRHPTIRQQADLFAHRRQARDLRAGADALAQRQRQGFQRQRALLNGTRK